MLHASYALGLAFTDEPDRKVVLVRKAKPSWQKGKLNAILGKLRAGELPQAAVSREFEERTGYKGPVHWRRFGRVRGFGYDVHLFAATIPAFAGQEILIIAPNGPEPVFLKPANNFHPSECFIPHLAWLIPLALDGNIADVRIENFHH